MILDLGSFTRTGLLVDRVHSAETLVVGSKRKGRGNNTIMEVVEDGETSNLSAL